MEIHHRGVVAEYRLLSDPSFATPTRNIILLKIYDDIEAWKAIGLRKEWGRYSKLL